MFVRLGNAVVVKALQLFHGMTEANDEFGVGRVTLQMGDGLKVVEHGGTFDTQSKVVVRCIRPLVVIVVIVIITVPSTLLFGLLLEHKQLIYGGIQLLMGPGFRRLGLGGPTPFRLGHEGLLVCSEGVQEGRRSRLGKTGHDKVEVTKMCS